MKRALLIVFFFAADASASAAIRAEFIAQTPGGRLAGSEACFFRGGPFDDPFFEKYLSSGEVRCFDADAVLDLPKGTWNVFLQHADGYTSNYPTYMLVDGPPIYTRSVSEMSASARIHFPTPGDGNEWNAVYVHDSGVAMVRPAGPDGIAIVPDGLTVLPMRVRRGTIVSIGQPFQASKTQPALAKFSSGDGRAVVALLRLAEGYRTGEGPWKAPEIRLKTADGRELRPLMNPKAGVPLDRTLAVFVDVRPGPAEIVVKGRHFATTSFPVAASSNRVQVIDDPIELTPGGALEVQATLPPVLPPLPCPDQNESPHPKGSPRLLRLKHCEGETCVSQSEILLSSDQVSSTLVNGLRKGTYEVEAVSVRSKATQRIEIEPGKDASVHLKTDPIVVTGRVTRGGKPIAAGVQFATGIAVADEGGRYVAYLHEVPKRETVFVLACEGGHPYEAIPDESISDGSVFDIDIPQNSVTARLRDAATGQQLRAPRGTVGILTPGRDVEWYFLEPDPDALKRGELIFRELPPNARAQVCGGHDGYRRTCLDPIQVASDETRTVTVDLSRLDEFAGKVVSAQEIVGGFVFFVGPEGQVRDKAHVKRDGSFTLRTRLAGGEHAVLVSRSHPLTVVTALVRKEETLEITLPVAPVASFEVRALPPRDARIALEIGGRVVPWSILSEHQSMQRQENAIRIHQPVMLIQGVAATGPIVVLAGPPLAYAAADVPPNTDLSELPQYRALFQRLPVQGPVVEISQ